MDISLVKVNINEYDFTSDSEWQVFLKTMDTIPEGTQLKYLQEAWFMDKRATLPQKIYHKVSENLTQSFSHLPIYWDYLRTNMESISVEAIRPYAEGLNCFLSQAVLVTATFGTSEHLILNSLSSITGLVAGLLYFHERYGDRKSMKEEVLTSDRLVFLVGNVLNTLMTTFVMSLVLTLYHFLVTYACFFKTPKKRKQIEETLRPYGLSSITELFHDNMHTVIVNLLSFVVLNFVFVLCSMMYVDFVSYMVKVIIYVEYLVCFHSFNSNFRKSCTLLNDRVASITNTHPRLKSCHETCLSYLAEIVEHYD